MKVFTDASFLYNAYYPRQAFSSIAKRIWDRADLRLEPENSKQVEQLALRVVISSAKRFAVTPAASIFELGIKRTANTRKHAAGQG